MTTITKPTAGDRAHLQVRLPRADLAALRRIAARNDRSLNREIARALRRHIEREIGREEADWAGD